MNRKMCWTLKIFFILTLALIAQTPGTEKISFSMNGPVEHSPAIGPNGEVYIRSISLDGLIIRYPDYANGSFGNSIAASSPAVDNTKSTLFMGSWDGKIYAYDLSNIHNEKWSFTTGGAVYSPPAIGSDGTVYAGSRDYNVYALNPDGTVKWFFTTGFYVDASPVIGCDGTVYVGSWDGEFYAINPDGTKKWSFVTKSAVESSPAIDDDGTIYCGLLNNELMAINPNGTHKWSFITEGPIYSSPAIGPDGLIYFGSDDNSVYALNGDGTKKWSFKSGGQIRSSPAIGSDGTIYVGSDDHKVYALNADGTEQWSFTTGAEVRSSPVLDDDGLLYIGSSDNKVYILYTASPQLALSPWPKYRKDMQNSGNSYHPHCPIANVTSDSIYSDLGSAITLDGSPSSDSDGDVLVYLWQCIKKPSKSTVTISDSGASVIQVACSDIGIYKFSLTVSDNQEGISSRIVTVFNGLVIHSHKTGGAVGSSPAIASDGTIYVGSDDNKVYALNPDGTE
ncbi:PQQ-binding-like beta-propeller repeat protein, partial [bacterium]|nr:PQQ-binding-like beta-propeller repeat protein [bacterium]